MDSIIHITVGILLPIIPAYILYKTLPAKTTVTGPFKGLNVQLGGAFGGYFLLVLVILGFFSTQPKPTSYEIWRVKGQVSLEQAAPASLLEKDVQLSIKPPLKDVFPDGRFWLDILVKQKETDEGEFPTLLIDHPLYQVVSIDLNEKEYPFGPKYSKEYDKKHKEIILKESVILKKR